jgi:hypothetical protein
VNQKQASVDITWCLSRAQQQQVTSNPLHMTVLGSRCSLAYLHYEYRIKQWFSSGQVQLPVSLHDSQASTSDGIVQ